MNWKRAIGWTAIGLLALTVVIAIGGYFFLKSRSFRRYALQRIEEQAQLATGGKTEMGGLDFSLSTLTAHLYNITVHGTEKPDETPLLHVDKLTVGLKILSALHRKVSLQELVIDHPVIFLRVDRNGKNNLPPAPPSQGDSHSSIFDLAIGHAQLTNGEVNYNDRKTPLDADLYELDADIHFAALARRCSGELSYNNGHVHYAQYASLSHSLNLKFNATPERLDLTSADFKIGSSDITLQAQMVNYSDPVADGQYHIRIRTQDFSSLSPAAAPAGDLVLEGKLHYQRIANAPVLRSISVDGRLASEMLSAAASGNRIAARRLQGTYKLAGGNLRVSDLSLESLGGRITASAEMNHLDATPDSRIQAALSGISLKALQQALGTKPPQSAELSGTLAGKAAASWKGSVNNVHAQTDLMLQAKASSTANPAAKDVPVNGAIHASYDGPTQTVALRETTVRIPSATITANGTVNDHSNLQLKVTATDLQQLAWVVASLSPGQTQLPAISGSATLDALMHGPVKKPVVDARLGAQNLHVEGTEWTSLKLALQASPSGITVRDGSLVNAQRGQATFSASVGLQNWEYRPANSIQAHLEGKQLRVAELLRLAQQNYPISGDLTANLSLSGSQLSPNGSGSAQITNARLYGESLQNLTAKFHAENGSISSALDIVAAAGAIDANLTYTPKTQAYIVKVNAPAVVLQKLQIVHEHNLPLVGTVSASVSGQGSLDDPQLIVILQLPELQVRQNSIGDLKAEIRVAQHAADLSLESKVSQATVHARGHVALSGDYQTDATIDTDVIALEVLAATYVPNVPQGFQGQAQLHATLKGPLKDKSRVEAHVSIPVLKASYQALQVGIAQPVRVDYANSVATLQPANIEGTGTSLRVQGRVPVGGNESANLSAQGSVDVRILKIVAPDVESSGIVTMDLHSSGSVSEPAITGQLQLKDVALTTADAPLGVAKLNGTLDVTGDRLQVSNTTGQVGGGEVSVGGTITYRPSLQFNLAVQAQSVRLRYPDGLRSLLDANLAFTGNADASSLNGRVVIASLSFTPDFDVAKFGDQFSTGATISQPGFADTVKLGIAVQSLENLNATSSQISIAGRMALQVGGTAANPVITGRTTLSSGELFYRNVRYQLQKGVITFDNPNETRPVLNLSVGTTIEQYNLTLEMRGPLDKLTTSYVSDPPLATADVINLVARGKTTQESAAASQSTDSMIAAQAASQIGSSVQKLAGISSLSIDPTIGGNNQNPSARVAIQQRVTKNLLFTFSTDVSEPGSEIVQGEYQISKRWSVSMSRDQLGGVSIDGKFRRKF